MNLLKLRFINVLFIFIIGIILGILISNSNDANSNFKTDYKPIYTNKTNENINEYPKKTLDNINNDENNPMDENESYIFPVKEENTELNIKKTELLKKDTTENIFDNDFFKDPKLYKDRDVYLKLQMILAKKTNSDWNISMLYTDNLKNNYYIYLNDPNSVIGNDPVFKIGYFYRVKFKSTLGEFEKGNNIIFIEPTEEKTSWATGLSAVE